MVVLVDIPRDMLAVYFLRALEATAELHVGFQRVDRFLRQPEAPLMGVAQAPGGGGGAEPNMDEGGRELPLVEVHGSYAWPVSGSDASRLKPHAHHGHAKPTLKTLKSYKSIKRPRSVAHLGKYATTGHERQSGGTPIHKDEVGSPYRPPPSPPPPDSEPADGTGTREEPAPPADQAGPASYTPNEVMYHSNPAFMRQEVAGSSGGGRVPAGESIPGQPDPSPSPGLSGPPPALLSASSALRTQLSGAGGLPPVEPSPSRKKIILQPLEAGSQLPNQPLSTVADSSNDNAATSSSIGSTSDSGAVRQARPRPAARFMEIPEDSVSGQAGAEVSSASIPGDMSNATPAGKPSPAKAALRFSVDSGLGSASGGRTGPRGARFDEPASEPDNNAAREGRTSGPGPRFAGAQVAPSSSEPSQDQASSYMKSPALGGPSFLKKHNQVTPAADVAARAEGKPAGHVVGFRDAHAVDHSQPSTAPEQPPSVAVKDVSLKFRRGELVAVVGTVGSGKSSLLSVILGEVPAVPVSRPWGRWIMIRFGVLLLL